MKRKKAVTYDVFRRGDDIFYDRLLSLLEKKLSIEINGIQRIRKEVFLVTTEHFNFILKGYSSYQKLKIQEAFTMALKREGFNQTYQFYSVLEEPIMMEGTLYGCIQYLQPNAYSFTYRNKSERKEALLLLEQFYSVTERLVNIYQYILPPFQIIDKWQTRKAQFEKNRDIVEKYIDETIINEIIFYAELSLMHIIHNQQYFDSKPKVILHGDVAHHNFLRDKDFHLNLIDFDLICIGPAVIDYIQFANRILPHMNWSYYELKHMPVYSNLMKEEAFLAALLYPTDILREWNRIIRRSQLGNKEMLNQVIHLTLEQYTKRKSFYEKIRRKI